MPIIISSNPISGTAASNILLSQAAIGLSISGLGGDDLIFGDWNTELWSIAILEPAGTGVDAASALDITTDTSAWFTHENPEVENATTVPYTSIVEGVSAPRDFWYSVTTTTANETLTIDIDHGNGSIMIADDLKVEVWDATGTTLLFSDDDDELNLETSAGSETGGGRDSFLQAVLASAGTYLIRIGAFEAGQPNNVGDIPAPTTFMANISLTGQTATGVPNINDDSLYGDAGNDTLYGQGGNDKLFGGDNDDVLRGGTGNDQLGGGNGADIVYGGDGNDQIFTDFDGVADQKFGGAGNDIFFHAGNIAVTGSVFDGGADFDGLIVFRPGTTDFRDDTVVNFEQIGFSDNALGPGNVPTELQFNANQLAGVTQVDASGHAGGNVRLAVTMGTATSLDLSGIVFGGFTESGDGTTVTGDGDRETITGTTGFDLIYGGGDSDILYGGAGNDSVHGDAGGDVLYGGIGNDQVFGGDNGDAIFGGGGTNDRLFGGDGGDFFNLVIADGPFGTISIDGGTGQDEILLFGGGTFDLMGLNVLDVEEIQFASGVDQTVILSTKELDDPGELGSVTIDGFVGSASDDVVIVQIDNTFNNEADLSGWTFQDWQSNDAVSIIGEGGNETITGSDQAESIAGNDGNDTVFGGDGNDTIEGGVGNDTLNGGGDQDSILGDVGNDLIILGDGDGLDNIDGGDDNDTYDASAETSRNLRIELIDGTHEDLDVGAEFNILNVEHAKGGGGNDEITGTTNDNSLFGGGGNDTLDGEAGDDIIYGGDGDDVIDMGTSSSNSVEAGADDDTVFWRNSSVLDMDTVDGGTGNDTIDADGFSFGDVLFDLGAGTYGFPGYSESWTNFEHYDNASGTGGENIIGTSGSNTISTGSGDNSINAGLGADTVNAGAGNDIIEDTGNITTSDSYDGGAGNDTLISATTWSDLVIFDLTNNYQTLTGFTTYDTYANIENLSVGGNAQMIGDAGANTLTALETSATSNENSISGEGGDDLIYAGLGEDEVDGGAGNDLIYAGDGNDEISGGGNNDTLFGGIEEDIIYGGLDDDVLYGGVNDDTLNGDAGNDTFFGGAGADSIDGGGNDDTADYSGSSARVTVFLNGLAGISGDAQGDTLTNVENLIGSNANDFLGGSAGSNSLSGGDSQDILDGQDGGVADTLNGGDGIDTAYYFGAIGNQVLDMSDHTNLANNQGEHTNDTWISIEGFFGANGFTNDLTGDNVANYLLGGSLGDTISGLDGADHLYGRGGNDTLIGGNGNDVLLAGEGTDTVTGGADLDIFYILTGNEIDIITDWSETDDFFFFFQITGVGSYSDLTFADIGTDVRITSANNTSFEIIVQNRELTDLDDQTHFVFG